MLTLDAPPALKAATAPPPTPVRVLHTRVVTNTGGGPDKTILNSPRFLHGTGYEAHCAYLHAPWNDGYDAIRERASAADAPLHGVLDRGPWDASVAWQLLRLCRRLDIRIWHGHDYKSNLLGLLLRPFHRMHLVTTMHGWVEQTARTPLYYWIDRRCLPRYDRVICVSDDLAQQALACGVRPERCTLIENAIDTAAYQRTLTPTEARQRLGLTPERRLIGAVGRLSEEKGFDLLIDAVGRLHQSGLEVDLAIAGEGNARGDLERLIAAQPHPERFHLLGFRSELHTFYQALDLFALSSRREGLPNVLLEAMSLETPVVATAVAGVPRLIKDGSTGRLIPPNDVAALQQALQILLLDDNLRERLAAQAREDIVARYDFSVRMQKVRAVYDGLPA